jgi:hypothetical protein
MGEFHQHPDGHIIVIGDAGTYVDSRANFEADFGAGPSLVTQAPLPDGANDHVYTQGKRHCFMGDGNVMGGGPMPWPEGDNIIAAVGDGLAAQAARREAELAALPPPEMPAPFQGVSPTVDVLYDQENRILALEGKPSISKDAFMERWKK